jgi:hypothetical protein
MILHLINLTGFSGNTYFDPLPLQNLNFKVKSTKKPEKVFTLMTQKPVPFTWKNGAIDLKLEHLNEFESIVMEW